MTISTTTNRVTYTGNGATVDFSFPYAFFAKADLVVIETVIATGVQTTKALTTHYTIAGSVDALGHYSSGGTVTALTAPASTVTWTIYRDPTATQTTDLVENDPMPAESIEAALDYQTMLNQRTRDIAARCLQQPEGDSATIDRLPAKVDRASRYLAFDADGDPIATNGTTEANPVSTFMATVLDDTTAALAAATLDVVPKSPASENDAMISAAANPTLVVNTTHATNRRAQLKFKKNGSSLFIIATDFDSNGTNNLWVYDSIAGAKRLQIESDGSITLPIGQLKFPAAQNPSTDVNTLDDYEEGSWTPSVGGTATYTVQDGQYVKIGKLVTVTCQMTINVIGTGSTTTISGLPFARGAAYMNATGAVYFTSLSQNVTTVVALTNDSITDVALYSLTAAGASVGLNAILGNGSVICFTLTYRASA